MGKLKWQDPPLSKDATGRAKWDPIAAELKENPRRWAVVAEAQSSTALAATIRHARQLSFLPAGTFEAVARKVPDSDPKVWDIYARYVGTDAAS